MNGIQTWAMIPGTEVTTTCASVRALVLRLVLRYLFPAASALRHRLCSAPEPDSRCAWWHRVRALV